jgi:hypothetical protein
MVVTNFEGYAISVNEADSTMSMVGKMAQLMLRGYSPENAYKHGVHKKRALSYKVACDLVIPFLENQELNVEYKDKHAVNLAKAYANLGKPEKAKVIGKTLVATGDYKNADKVFRYGKIKSLDVINELDGPGKESYLNHVVQGMKTRRERSLQKRQQKAGEELLVPVALQIEQLDKRLKKVKEERVNELDQYEKMKGEYSTLLSNTYTPENGREFYENARKAGKLWNKIFKRYGSNEDLRNPKESKLTELTEKMVSTNERIEAKNKEYSENEREYFETIGAMETRYKQKMQMDAEKLGYKGELFPEPKKEPPMPEWKKEIESGEIDISTHKGRRALRKTARDYAKNGDFDNAVAIYGQVGRGKDRRAVRRLNEYLEEAEGKKGEAATKYFRNRNRWRYYVAGGLLGAMLIGAGVCNLKKKPTQYVLKEITMEDKYKDLAEEPLFYAVKDGDRLLKITERFNPALNQQELAKKNNAIATQNSTKYPGLLKDTRSVLPTGEVVNRPDGIIGDEITSGMQIEVGKKLVAVTKKDVRKMKVPFPL